MLDLRKRIFIIIGVSAGLIIAIILGYIVLRDSGPEEINETQQTTNEIENSGIGTTQETTGTNREVQNIAPLIDPTELYVRQLARDFVERFGTYSTHGDNQHIDDVSYLATPSMVRWIETQRIQTSEEYRGVTTRVISHSLENIDNNSAEVIVGAQQELQKRATSEMKNRTARVELTKTNGEWKISGMFWEL